MRWFGLALVVIGVPMIASEALKHGAPAWAVVPATMLLYGFLLLIGDIINELHGDEE